ncbi:inositolphosphotransferase Ecym_5553 [Eremothecium cymbalariae DBVPG|uniref:Inositolphosphotransferase Aur1/Ipt1 domain-containing protein n=1 Tax=Eremothecium cymbalariae (strain CBS 270.75 / DBVPG 7215 / KCTC 17166 / NRRL Y-17582) TaxID=931890 RepID=I6NE01_ERECY|nr:hypothetical protein Ecym_5553 [Eremothecium cymbalariae DBVPG\
MTVINKVMGGLLSFYRAVFWERTLVGLAWNFWWNFLPVFVWLTIFKNARVIPAEIRPPIHSKAAFFWDLMLFGDSWGEFRQQAWPSDKWWEVVSWATGVTFTVCCGIVPLLVWYYIYYVRRVQYNVLEWYEDLFHQKGEQQQHLQFRPTQLRVMLPFFMPLFTCIMVNVAHHFARQEESTFTSGKDILAWISYVCLHLGVPVTTAVYLYVFQPPGTLKCFGFALGIQNIAGVFTHLLLPTAPPWFIHMYGVNDTEHVNYLQEGYAAGLTRVDMHWGTRLNRNGFHKSPVVFGAAPSLHSAIAVQCFLFLISRSTSTAKTPAAYDLQNRSRVCSSSSDSSSDSSSCDAQMKDEEMDNIPKYLEESIPSSASESDLMLQQYPDSFSPFAEAHLSSSVSSFKMHADVMRTSKWLWIFNKSLIPKIFGFLYICIQWWATIYLDHHFRFDLFVGALYAIVSFVIINTFFLQPKVLKNWVEIRLSDNKLNPAGKTMGMRVFQGTRFEWLFDPLA